MAFQYKITLFTPTYNRAYILDTLYRSVQRQTFRNFEWIIMDDGSTDNSGMIADEYAYKHPSITIYHQVNGGVSDARNYGLDRMNGDYVTFVDSDDELSPNTLEPLLNIMHNHPEYDILEYSVLQNPGEHDETFIDLGNHNYPYALDWLMTNGTRHCWMWNKIFRKEIFNNLRFPKQLRRFEDMWMMGEILKNNPKIATTTHGTYKYYWNPNGLMASMDTYIELINAQMDIIRKHSIDTRKKQWHKLYMDMYNIQLYIYIQSGKIVIPSQRVMPYPYNGIQGLVKSLALDLFGINGSCKLFNLFYRTFKNGKQ